MTSLDMIKSKMRKLYNTNPNIHINASITTPKVHFSNEPVTITGIYPYIFQIEECSSGSIKRHTIKYTDILTKQIEIKELELN